MEVAANCGGTLSVGTRTMTSEATPWPALVKNKIAASTQGTEYKAGTSKARGTTVHITAISSRIGLRPRRSDTPGRSKPRKKLPRPPAPRRNPAVVAAWCAVCVIYRGAKTFIRNNQEIKPAEARQHNHMLR